MGWEATRPRKSKSLSLRGPANYALGYHVQTGNKGTFLSLDFGRNKFGRMSRKERFRRYREFVYEVGALEGNKGARVGETVLKQERKKPFELTRVERFRYRTRYFTDSDIIESKEYVHRNFQHSKSFFKRNMIEYPNRPAG